VFKLKVFNNFVINKVKETLLLESNVLGASATSNLASGVKGPPLLDDSVVGLLPRREIDNKGTNATRKSNLNSSLFFSVLTC
jgi:hypothetical protein